MISFFRNPSSSSSCRSKSAPKEVKSVTMQSSTCKKQYALYAAHVTSYLKNKVVICSPKFHEIKGRVKEA
jgi:hypothetical protein